MNNINTPTTKQKDQHNTQKHKRRKTQKTYNTKHVFLFLEKNTIQQTATSKHTTTQKQTNHQQKQHKHEQTTKYNTHSRKQDTTHTPASNIMKYTNTQNNAKRPTRHTTINT